MEAVGKKRKIRFFKLQTKACPGAVRIKGPHPAFRPSGKIEKKGERIEEEEILKIKEKLTQASNIIERMIRRTGKLPDSERGRNDIEILNVEARIVFALLEEALSMANLP